MATAREVLRGTFRLSVVVALVTTAYHGYGRYSASIENQNNNRSLVTTLECGARLPDETLRTALIELGMIDLSKVGCASQPFRASFDEIAKARDDRLRKEWIGNSSFDIKDDTAYALMLGLVALISINLLGLAFLGMRAVVRWVAEGYKPRA